MNLILWRHAQAHDALADQSDVQRSLTQRGEKQAKRMAEWLDRHLPQGTLVLTSPARRTLQTVAALGRKFRSCPELLPGASVASVLALAQWPDNRTPVLLVGHQPTLGLLIGALTGLAEQTVCPVQKGAVWWLRQRQRGEGLQTIVATVQSPEFL